MYLPALTRAERIVLYATCSHQTCDMRRYLLCKGNSADFPTRRQWAAARQLLVNKGLLTKSGTPTNIGRALAFVL